MRLVSALLAVWYMVAVVGIDIHHDGHENHTYVVPLLVGTSCSVIHPGVDCSCHHHHHHHDICCENEAEGPQWDDCCTNEVEVVSLSGEDRQPLVLAAFVKLFSTVLLPEPDFVCCSVRSSSPVMAIHGRDSLAKNCILRV